MITRLLIATSLSLVPLTNLLAQHLEEGKPNQEKIAQYEPRFGRKKPVIAVVALNEGTEITDFIVPFGILSRADIAKVISVSTSPGAVTIEPLKFNLQSTIADFDKEYPEGADYLIVPAVHGGNDQSLVQWVAAQGEKGGTVVSICLGAMVVAKTGMMDGHRATSYFGNEKKRVEEYPDIKWQKNIRYVADGKIISSAGISASIPISLALVEAISGYDKASALAKDLGVLDWSATHNSDVFQQKPGEAPPGRGKESSKETVGIPVKKDDDEIALALTAEVYRFTGMALPYVISKTHAPIELANGLMVLPGKINGGTDPVKRMLPALRSAHPITTLDLSLKRIEKIYGRTAAYNAARIMEYPGIQNFLPDSDPNTLKNK